jgi:dUTP pyrophosphatase
MKVKIRRASQAIPLPVYGTKDAAAFDLASSEEASILPGEIRMVHTGLFVEAPPGYFLAIFSRSSTPIKRGLMLPHGVGILDPDYSGPDDEILLEVYNFTDQPVDVKIGDRVCQGIFLPVQQVEWEETEQLSEVSRGGFGSTGK